MMYVIGYSTDSDCTEVLTKGANSLNDVTTFSCSYTVLYEWSSGTEETLPCILY